MFRNIAISETQPGCTNCTNTRRVSGAAGAMVPSEFELEFHRSL